MPIAGLCFFVIENKNPVTGGGGGGYLSAPRRGPHNRAHAEVDGTGGRQSRSQRQARTLGTGLPKARPRENVDGTWVRTTTVVC